MLDFLLGLQYFGTKGSTVEAVGLTVLYAGLFELQVADLIASGIVVEQAVEADALLFLRGWYSQCWRGCQVR